MLVISAKRDERQEYSLAISDEYKGKGWSKMKAEDICVAEKKIENNIEDRDAIQRYEKTRCFYL